MSEHVHNGLCNIHCTIGEPCRTCGGSGLDGVTGVFQPVPAACIACGGRDPAAAVPEAQDGRPMDPLLSAPMARMAALDDKAAGQYARVNPDWLVALIDLATAAVSAEEEK